MKQNEAGVRQLDNGCWEYRFIMVVDGKKKISRKRRDGAGNPFKTKKAAIKAREEAMEAAKMESTQTAPVARKTVMEVFEEYCEKGRSGKAYATKRKQDSLWINHINPRFGSRYVDEISAAEVNDYLTQLYYDEEKAYKYVESFLKMFYRHRNRTCWRRSFPSWSG